MSSSLSQKWTELFGAKLLKKEESKATEVDTMDALKDAKVVAIYFSAHWCPPCRGFTPKLAEWYNKDLKAKGIEVVFASSDRDEKAFNDYYAEMPWLAMKYSERDLKAKLGSLCKCRGIPYLALFNPDTSLISLEGRAVISKDPTAKDYPWAAPTLAEVLAPLTFKDKEGKDFKLEKGFGKKVAFYFSAHWCPPCRNFTPKLAELYKKIAADKNWEVIFCSSDRDEAAFREYYNTMPWAHLPYAERDAKAKLSDYFGVEGIPTLVMLDENLEEITREAVSDVSGDPEGKDFPWIPKPFNDIDSNPNGIDEGPAFVVIDSEVDEAEKANNGTILLALSTAAQAAAEAKKEEAKAKTIFDLAGGDSKVVFFQASQKGGRLRDRVASECNLKTEKKTQVVLLYIHEGGKYIPFPKDKAFTRESAEQFLQDSKDGKLTKKQMGANE